LDGAEAAEHGSVEVAALAGGFDGVDERVPVALVKLRADRHLVIDQANLVLSDEVVGEVDAATAG
jgi:hypothetical protein